MKMDKLLWKRVVTIVFVFFAIKFKKAVAANGTIPALFSFGDSILDTGNNNNLQTLTKANYPPYGRDFPGGKPTGRFCNGKILSDLIAEALGIKATLPAYLSGNLSPQDLVTGVSFASAGSGIDDLTAQMQGVLSQPTQLGMFREYIGKLTANVGKQHASEILSNSMYLVSAGNNDIGITYSQILAPTTPFPVYAARLIETISNFLKSVYELGARKMWVLSTLPLGCLPGARSAAGGALRECAALENQIAQLFNAQLSSAVDSIKASLPQFDIRFIDVYTPLLFLIQNPQSSGFVDVADGCCGSEAGVCSLLSVCPNPSAYVFWDFGHPTQRAYQIVVSSILKSHTHNVSASFAPSVNSTSHY